MYTDKQESPELAESVALALGAVTRTYCQFDENCATQVS